MARFRPCRRHLSPSAVLLTTGRHYLVWFALWWARRNYRACKQALHFTARIVACEQGFVERGVDFSSRDDYRSYSPSGWILPLPPPQRGRLQSLLAVYAKYEDNTFVKNSLLPFFDKDKTTLLPYLRFRRTNTSPCLVLVQEKCNVCYHYNRVTQYFLTGNRGCGDSFEAKNIWDQYLQN